MEKTENERKSTLKANAVRKKWIKKKMEEKQDGGREREGGWK